MKSQVYDSINIYFISSHLRSNCDITLECIPFDSCSIYKITSVESKQSSASGEYFEWLVFVHIMWYAVNDIHADITAQSYTHQSV